MVLFFEKTVLSYECKAKWSHLRDMNPRPADYKSAALPGYAKVAVNLGIMIMFKYLSLPPKDADI